MDVPRQDEPWAPAGPRPRKHRSTRREGLLLVGHGRRGWPDSVLLAMAERLIGERLDVSVAVLRGRPALADALRTLSTQIVHVVPVFMAHGQLASSLRFRLPVHGRSRLILHPTVGSQPGMAALVEGAIRRTLAERGLRRDETAVVLAGHGNARHPSAGVAIHTLADRLRGLAVAAEIHSVFLEQEPVVEEWPALTRLPAVLVVPCFLSGGAHAREDLPRRLRMTGGNHGDAALDPRLHLAPSLAMSMDGLAAVIRDLVSAGQSRVTALPIGAGDCFCSKVRWSSAQDATRSARNSTGTAVRSPTGSQTNAPEGPK